MAPRSQKEKKRSGKTRWQVRPQKMNWQEVKVLVGWNTLCPTTMDINVENFRLRNDNETLAAPNSELERSLKDGASRLENVQQRLTDAETKLDAQSKRSEALTQQVQDKEHVISSLTELAKRLEEQANDAERNAERERRIRLTLVETYKTLTSTIKVVERPLPPDL